MISSSINVKYDFFNKKIYKEYFATNSHSNLIKGILKNSIYGTGNSAHIVYGAYGSGKSLISTIITSILSKTYSEQETIELSQKFKNTDENIGELILDNNRNSIKYIPIILSGNQEDFDRSIMISTKVALDKYELKISLPGLSREITNIIDLWKKSYIDTYNKFLEELKIKKLSLSAFYKKIKIEDIKIIDWFKQVHKDLTSGMELDLSNSISVIEFLEIVTEELRKLNFGIFIVYDEFGRVMQNMASSKLSKFMSTMQDIAELSNNGSSNMQVLFVAHKPISYYFSFESKDNRSEFAKVEKRFSVYEITSDYVTFLKIASKYIFDNFNVNETVIPNINFSKYNVFAGILNDLEIREIVIKDLFPLHPITTYLLPNISKIFGQNERTLFTFLSDKSKDGLLGHYIKNNKKYYYPDSLIDYFFSNIDESYIEDILEYKMYQKNISNIGKLIKSSSKLLAKRVYKFITLWQISSESSNILLTPGFISYSLGQKEEKVLEVLNELYTAKKVRFNQFTKQWEIFEGSTLDIEKTITKETDIHQLDTILEYIEVNNPYRYIYSTTFNSKHEITRFAEVFFEKNNVYSDKYGKQNSDANILVHIISNETEKIEINNSELNIIIKSDFELIKKLIIRRITLEKIKNNSSYLRTYPNLDSELDYEIMLCDKQLSGFYSSCINTNLFLENKKYRVKNIRDIEKILDDIFKNKYNKTLKILNDQINMFKLTNIQKSAIIQVLDTIINNNTIDLDDTFSGSKPADLVYFTVIKHIVDNEVSENIEIMDEISLILREYIKSNPNGNLNDVLNILESPPYGLRPPVSILILFRQILDLWKDMLLFQNDNYIPTIETEELYSALIVEKRIIHYSFSSFDNNNRDFLEELSRIFDDTPESVKHKSLSVLVCSGMYNWYLNLPVITQQMQDMPFSDMRFTKIISESRINPKKAVENLIELFTIDDVVMFKNNLENHIDNYLGKIRDHIKLLVGHEDLVEWAKNLDPIKQKSNRLANRIINSKDYLNEYIKEIENLEINKWTRSSFEMLKKEITEDFYLLSNDVKYSTVIINGKTKYVQDINMSKKTENAYQNIVNTIDATKRYYSQSELEQMILKLINDYIK